MVQGECTRWRRCCCFPFHSCTRNTVISFRRTRHVGVAQPANVEVSQHRTSWPWARPLRVATPVRLEQDLAQHRHVESPKSKRYINLPDTWRSKDNLGQTRRTFGQLFIDGKHQRRTGDNPVTSCQTKPTGDNRSTTRRSRAGLEARGIHPPVVSGIPLKRKRSSKRQTSIAELGGGRGNHPSLTTGDVVIEQKAKTSWGNKIRKASATIHR